MSAIITAILLFCAVAVDECRELPLPGVWPSLKACELAAAEQAKARGASGWRCRVRWDEPA